MCLLDCRSLIYGATFFGVFFIFVPLACCFACLLERCRGLCLFKMALDQLLLRLIPSLPISPLPILPRSFSRSVPPHPVLSLLVPSFPVFRSIPFLPIPSFPPALPVFLFPVPCRPVSLRVCPFLGTFPRRVTNAPPLGPLKRLNFRKVKLFSCDDKVTA